MTTKQIEEHSLAYQAVADQLLARYTELFPNYAWTDSTAALNLMAAEVKTLRMERAEAIESKDTWMLESRRIQQHSERLASEILRLRSLVEFAEHDDSLFARILNWLAGLIEPVLERWCDRSEKKCRENQIPR